MYVSLSAPLRWVSANFFFLHADRARKLIFLLCFVFIDIIIIIIAIIIIITTTFHYFLCYTFVNPITGDADHNDT